MWVRRSAIRPVPSYATLPSHALESVRDNLAEDDEEARTQLDEAFERFERAQPALAAHVADALGKPLDETALALGYFLALTVWLAFERTHGSYIDEVKEEELQATDELLTLDEELRRADPAEALDSDDVIAMEQPHVLSYIHEHIDATLDAHAEEIDVDDVHTVYRVVLVEILALSYIHEHIDATLDAHAEEIDVDDVHTVYRVVLVEILALSYSVRRPEGYPVAKTELLA